MQGNTAKKSPPAKKTSSSDDKDKQKEDTIELLSKRQSQELVIGLCGLIGTGMHSVRLCLEEQLKLQGYDIIHVHISTLIKKHFHPDLRDLGGSERYKTYQILGDNIRSKHGGQILAEAAISEIAFDQRQRAALAKNKGAESKEDKNKPVDWKFKSKVAYVIDQIKNPAEVELLRLVYQHNFYYLGVTRSEVERKRNLRDEGISDMDIDELIHLDRKSSDNEGQQTQKAILDADFYLRNTQSHHSDLKEKIKRFIDLIHGVNGVTPTVYEKGMFSAFSASLQSACLSRQVGAAIMDDEGNILVTGRNDVPKFNGGLYSHEDSANDFRCIHKGGKCYNDSHKNKIKDSIKNILENNELVSKYITTTEDVDLEENEEQHNENLKRSTFVNDLIDELYKETRLSSLIEFSRSIHAEMDAITSLARLGRATTQGKTLYTTTYPCHNCARHIVAAGITKVIYIEPYEKSLAIDLHDDAIIDTPENINGKVIFDTFEGVAPRRFSKFFYSTADRKTKGEGKALRTATKYDNHVDIQFLDSAQTFQVKIFDGFKNKSSIDFDNL